MGPLLKVFVDQSCDLRDGRKIRALRPVTIDILHDAQKLKDGGVLLVGPQTHDGASSLRILRQLRASNPDLIICVCTPWDKAVLQNLPRYALAGVDRLFTIASSGDVTDLVRFLSVRILAPPPLIALQVVANLASPSRPLRVTMHIFRNSERYESLDAVAGRFGCASRTIEDWMERSEFPCVSDLSRCGRFLHDAELFSRGVEKPLERAWRLGFGTPTNLRQWVWRLRRTVDRDRRLRSFASLVPSLHPLLKAEEPE